MDKKVTLPILEYYDSRIKEWTMALIDKSLDDLGGIFTLQGTVSSVEELNALPVELLSAGDVYLIGPLADNSYDEYVWTNEAAWEFLGTTKTDTSGLQDIQGLYSGVDGTGTPDDPAEGTVLYELETALRAEIEKSTSLEII